MEYSAVTQPMPLSFRNGGTFSSTLAVHSTHVSPHFTSTLPAACFVKPRTNSTLRSWSLLRAVVFFVLVMILFLVFFDYEP
jgi:hypothetical protein